MISHLGVNTVSTWDAAGMGRFIFPKAMQGSLSNEPRSVSSSSSLSCQAHIRKLHGGIAGLCAPLVRTIFAQHMEAIFVNPERQDGHRSFACCQDAPVVEGCYAAVDHSGNIVHTSQCSAVTPTCLIPLAAPICILSAARCLHRDERPLHQPQRGRCSAPARTCIRQPNLPLLARSPCRLDLLSTAVLARISSGFTKPCVQVAPMRVHHWLSGGQNTATFATKMTMAMTLKKKSIICQ